MQPLATATRHRLVEDHLQIPNCVANSFSHFRSSAALEDIVADGRAGLVEAANSFDPTRGNTFKTFAWYRVRGAILDSARRLGPRSRSEQERYLKSAGEPGFTHHPLNNRRDHQHGGAPSAGEYDWPDMERTIDRRRLFARALAEVAKLPKRDQALVESFYIAGRTMQETAAVLGHCEFYTSRLHGKVLRKLRQALKVHANVMPVES